MATLKEAVSTLLKNGAKRVDNITVNNVTVRELESYTRVALTLKDNVHGYIQKEDRSYEEGETNVIFVSLFSITSVLKENDDAAFAVNEILENPKSLQVLLSHATISILQEQVTAGEVRVNPFTGVEDENVLDHNSIFNHVVSIKFGKMGELGLNKMMDKMLAV